MTSPKFNIFIKGGKINQSLASVWYAFVVKTNNNNSYIVFEQTQTRQFLKVAFTFFYGKILKSHKEKFLLNFFSASLKMQYLFTRSLSKMEKKSWFAILTSYTLRIFCSVAAPTKTQSVQADLRA